MNFSLTIYNSIQSQFFRDIPIKIKTQLQIDIFISSMKKGYYLKRLFNGKHPAK